MSEVTSCSRTSSIVSSIWGESLYQRPGKVRVSCTLLLTCGIRQALVIPYKQQTLGRKSYKSCFLVMQSSSQGDQRQCGSPCELMAPPYDGGQQYLSGPCGCVAGQGTCSAEFSGGIVRDLCEQMGGRQVSVADTDSSALQGMAQRSMGRLQGSQKPALALLATSE